MPAGDASQQPLIIALISALAAIVVGAFSALVGLARRGDAPAPRNSDDDRANPRGGNERTAVLEQRANDTDEWKDMQDRKLEAVMRFLDRRFPDWRP